MTKDQAIYNLIGEIFSEMTITESINNETGRVDIDYYYEKNLFYYHAKGRILYRRVTSNFYYFLNKFIPYTYDTVFDLHVKKWALRNL